MSQRQDRIDPGSAGSAEVVPLRADQVGAAGGVLAASLADDPGWSHVYPRRGPRLVVLRAMLTAAARDAVPFGGAYAAVAGGRLLGAAVWLPPGHYPWSAARKARATPSYLRVLAAAPRSLPGLMRFGANVERAFPADPVWYLEVLGVAPGLQGRGLGSRLLQPALARADRDALPCYLETATRGNVAFYERLGFRAEHDALPLVPGGPTHWTMRRPARGA